MNGQPSFYQTLKLYLSPALFLSSLIFCDAQVQAPFPLWPNGAPGALGVTSNDIPTLTPYLPDASQATGAAMVICPGGGYSILAPHEGNDYALWLCQHGVTGFVLKYRLGSAGYRHPAMLQDAARALRFVRAKAADWKIDPTRIGIMGSSAGGHLASTLLTHFDSGHADAEDPIERQSSRPDVGVLCYAVITMEGQYVNAGSKRNLLGLDPSPELVRLLSNESQVTSNTPPCFIWTTYEDNVVPLENSLMFAEALRKNHVPFALHIYEKGGHGMGLAEKPPFAHPHPWASDCLFWLKEQNFVN
jgi:acetyl esterase/lipase